MVLRIVERNPLRANMVERNQDWESSRLKPTARSGPEGLLGDEPILKPAQWTRHVNGVETGAELKALRHKIARGTPFGDTDWQTELGRGKPTYHVKPRGPRLRLNRLLCPSNVSAQ